MDAAAPLKLAALDAEDLEILSAHLQDAILKVRDLHWLPSEKRFVLEMNRFAWETAGRIWYDAMFQLSSRSQFADIQAITTQIAADDKRFDKDAKKIVAAAWKKVGL